jgi:hypothetical protein
MDAARSGGIFIQAHVHIWTVAALVFRHNPFRGHQQMTDIPTLLLIDKNLVHAEAFREVLLKANDGPFHDEWVQTPSQSMERLSAKTVWAVFANSSLPDSRGLNSIKEDEDL